VSGNYGRWIYAPKVIVNKIRDRKLFDLWVENSITDLAGISGSNGKLKAKFVNWLKDYKDWKCEICQWGETNQTTNRVPVEVDHINGNNTDHVIINLRVLCPNCHSLTPTYKKSNRKGLMSRQNKLDSNIDS